jgi:hypothetical protein
MQRFLQDKNLSLFLRRLLAEQKQMNEERRQVILKLLAEEEAKIDRVSQRVSDVGFPRAPLTTPFTRRAHRPFATGHMPPSRKSRSG